MELVLYYIVESRNLLISFLILTFVLGIIVYSLIKNFKQNKKMKVVIYGLFLKFTNVDILKLSIIVVKTFLVFYAIMVTNELVMWLCIAMITILTSIYIICEFKRVIYEVIYTSIQALVIYLIYLILLFQILFHHCMECFLSIGLGSLLLPHLLISFAFALELNVAINL